MWGMIILVIISITLVGIYAAIWVYLEKCNKSINSELDFRRYGFDTEEDFQDYRDEAAISKQKAEEYYTATLNKKLAEIEEMKRKEAAKANQDLH